MQKPNKEKIKRTSPSVTAFIGALLTLIGGFFLSYNYIQAKTIVAYDYMSKAYYDGNDVVIIPEGEEQNDDGLPEEVTNEYIGYLTIPKINLVKGFLDSRSEENNGRTIPYSQPSGAKRPATRSDAFPFTIGIDSSPPTIVVLTEIEPFVFSMSPSFVCSFTIDAVKFASSPEKPPIWKRFSSTTPAGTTVVSPSR